MQSVFDRPTLAKPRLLIVGLAALAVGALATIYGSSLTENAGQTAEARILGGWLLSVVGLGLVMTAQVTYRGVRQAVPAAQPDADVLDWRSQLVRPAVGLLSGGAALIHFAVVSEHFEESALFGAFFVALSVFQMGWAIAAVVRPNRWLLVVGALANVAVVAVWALSRTVGLPIGPEAGEPVAAGFGDAVASAFELLIAVGALVLLRRSVGARRVRPSAATTVTSTLALIVLTFTALGMISAVGGSIFVPPAG